jgi:hypothetical protein
MLSSFFTLEAWTRAMRASGCCYSATLASGMQLYQNSSLATTCVVQLYRYENGYPKLVYLTCSDKFLPLQLVISTLVIINSTNNHPK